MLRAQGFLPSFDLVQTRATDRWSGRPVRALGRCRHRRSRRFHRIVCRFPAQGQGCRRAHAAPKSATPARVVLPAPCPTKVKGVPAPSAPGCEQNGNGGCPSKGKGVTAPSPPKSKTPVSQGPVISNFSAANPGDDVWVFRGKVTDKNGPVKGMIVTFGGVLASYNLTATVQANGTFYLSVCLPGVVDGTGTAQTTDSKGIVSNLAMDLIMA